MPKYATALSHLLKLNLELSDAAAKKNKIVGPGLEALGGDFAENLPAYVSGDCVGLTHH